MRGFLVLANCALFVFGLAFGFLRTDLESRKLCDRTERDQLVAAGLLAMDDNSPDDALIAISSIMSCEPATAAEEVLKARVMFAKGEFEEAEKYCGQAIRLNPYTAEAFGIRGQIYYQQRQLPKALRDLNRSIELDPSWVHFQEARVELQEELGLSTPLSARFPASLKAE